MIDFKLILEKERLSKAVDAFAAQMKKELHEQAKKGKRGWDDLSDPRDGHIVSQMFNDAEDFESDMITEPYAKERHDPLCVAIASRCMILWARHNSVTVAPDKENGNG